MIPLVGFLKELKAQAKIVHETAEKVFAEKGVKVEYLVGTMIELPRACVAADQIAKEAEFFSFGTNDLTQTGLGMSRDDYGSFIRHYLENDLVPKRPVPDDRLRRRRRADEDRRREGPRGAGRPEDRHLRRARRRPGQRQVLPQDRAAAAGLRRAAQAGGAQKLAQEKPGQTLQATALVHEAYLRLVDGTRGPSTGTAAATSSPPRPRPCAASSSRTPAASRPTSAAGDAGARVDLDAWRPPAAVRRRPARPRRGPDRLAPRRTRKAPSWSSSATSPA